MKLHKILYASAIALLSGMGFASCDVNFDNPPVISPDLGGDGKWDAPLSVPGAYAYYNAYYSDAPETDKYYWVTGYIVGCVNTTETVFTCTDQTAAFAEPFDSKSNLLLAPTPDCTDYTRCISLQLPSGAVRNGLNLNENPTNLGREVSVRGYIDKYLGIPGLRSITHFVWGPLGVDTGDVEVGKSEYILLTGAIKSGRAYALVYDGTAAQTVTAAEGSGFLYTEAVSISDNKFTASEKYGFTLIETAEGSGQYYLADYTGKFLYQAPYGTGWSNRPSVATAPLKDDKSFLWQPSSADGNTWVIGNVASGSVLAYDTSYKSYGIYSSLGDQYKAPQLFEMSNDPSNVPDVTPVEPGDPGEITVGSGDGTLESPYDAERALAIINAGSMSTNEVYIKGKISKIDEVDTSYGNATYYISNDGSTTNQLEVFRGYYFNGDKFTSADAIKVGDEVVILGKLIKYNTTPEVAQGSKIISLNGETSGSDTPVVPPTSGEGDGTLESPYDAVRALAIINAGTMTENEVYIKGKISKIDEVDTSYGNATYYISNDGSTTNQLEVFRGYYLDGAKFTSTDAIKVGDEVVILGKLTMFYSTPEVAQGSKIISINGNGGDTPDDPTPSEETIYSGLVSNCDDWTIDNVTIPEAATYVWGWKEYNGSGYLNASCFIGGTAYASEAYAYTTVDLSGKSDASVTFEHAAKFQTTLKELCGPVVRVAGTSAWTALSIPTWPDAGSWTFVSSGTISLKAYAGKKIEIGFKYGSSDNGADTWEIKNFTVTGK